MPSHPVCIYKQFGRLISLVRSNTFFIPTVLRSLNIMPPAIESGRTTPYDAAVAKLSEVYEAVSPYAVVRRAVHV